MVTDEVIPGGPYGAENVYLMETEVWPGNSGSPVFFWFGKSRGPPIVSLAASPSARRSPILLAGVVQGYYPDRFTSQNSGVAAVVPAYKLHDMLFSSQEIKFRSDAFKAEVKSGYN